MNYRFSVIVCLFALTSIAEAQNPQQTGGRRGRAAVVNQPEEARETRVIRLEYAKASSAADIVRTIMSLQIVADGRTNSVVVNGTAEELEQVIKLVASLDQQHDTTVLEEDLNVVSVRNREVDEVTKRLSQLYRNEIQITGDDKGRRVILRGNARTIQSALNVVEQMDVPLPTATVEFAYFQVGTSDAEFSMEIPDDLAPVARQIARFGTPRLVGRLTTSAVEGQQFSLKGQIAESTHLSVAGRLLAAAHGGAVKLELTSELKMNRINLDENVRKMEAPRFSLSTTVIAKRGDFVVLGSAPLGWAPGESVILVVQIPETAR